MNNRPMPRSFVLCADDYAMTPAVTSGILTVLEAGRISATGAMTNRPYWRDAARDLAAFAGKVDLGVHLNLTCGAPLTTMARFAPTGELPKLPIILARGHLNALPLDEIAAEISAQLSAFEDAMGRQPDFIDGHQHVHAMPGVRRALAQALTGRYGTQKPYLRDAADTLSAIRQRGRNGAKAALLALLARPFAKRMRALGFALNEGFSGYSRFHPEDDYAAEFTQYLVAPGPKHLIMCHPGDVDDELRALDPAVESRPAEIRFFFSERFADLCAEANMHPARFSSL